MKRLIVAIAFVLMMLAVWKAAGQIKPPAQVTKYVNVCLTAKGTNCQYLPLTTIIPPSPWTCAPNATGGTDCSLNGALSAVKMSLTGTGTATFTCPQKGYVWQGIGTASLKCVPGSTP